jgi:hypothetical protein
MLTQGNLCGSGSGCYPGAGGGGAGGTNNDPANIFSFAANRVQCPDQIGKVSNADQSCDRVTSMAFYKDGPPPSNLERPNLSYKYGSAQRLAEASFEHVIYSPIGFTALIDEGKVALRGGDLDFTHLRHSYAAGLTLRAGGFPMVWLLFSWGGREGTHTIGAMNTSLLGASPRPSLY